MPNVSRRCRCRRSDRAYDTRSGKRPCLRPRHARDYHSDESWVRKHVIGCLSADLLAQYKAWKGAEHTFPTGPMVTSVPVAASICFAKAWVMVMTSRRDKVLRHVTSHHGVRTAQPCVRALSGMRSVLHLHGLSKMVRTTRREDGRSSSFGPRQNALRLYLRQSWPRIALEWAAIWLGMKLLETLRPRCWAASFTTENTVWKPIFCALKPKGLNRRP